MTLSQLSTKFYTKETPSELLGWRNAGQSLVPTLSLEARFPYLVNSRKELNSQPRYPRSRVPRHYYYSTQYTSDSISRAVLIPSHHKFLLPSPPPPHQWTRPKRTLLDKSDSHHSHTYRASSLSTNRLSQACRPVKPQQSDLCNTVLSRIQTATVDNRKCCFSKSCPVLIQDTVGNEVIQECRIFTPMTQHRCLPEAFFKAPPSKQPYQSAAFLSSSVSKSYALHMPHTQQVCEALQCSESSDTSSPEPSTERPISRSVSNHILSSLSLNSLPAPPLPTQPSVTLTSSCQPVLIVKEKHPNEAMQHAGLPLELRPAALPFNEHLPDTSEALAVARRLEPGTASTLSTRPSPTPPVSLRQGSANESSFLPLPPAPSNSAILSENCLQSEQAPSGPNQIVQTTSEFSPFLAPSKLSTRFQVRRNPPTANRFKVTVPRISRRRSISFHPNKRKSKQNNTGRIGRRQSLQLGTHMLEELQPWPSESSSRTEKSVSLSFRGKPPVEVKTVTAVVNAKEPQSAVRTIERKHTLISQPDLSAYQIRLERTSSNSALNQKEEVNKTRDYFGPEPSSTATSQILREDLPRPPNFPSRQAFMSSVPKAFDTLASSIALSVFRVASQFSQALAVSMPSRSKVALPIVDELVQELYLRRRKGPKLPTQEVQVVLDSLKSGAYMCEAFTAPVESRWPRPQSRETQLSDIIEADPNNLQAALWRQRFQQLLRLFPNHDRLLQRDSLVQTPRSHYSRSLRPQGSHHEKQLRARPVYTATNLELGYYTRKQKALHRAHSDPMVRPRREERYEERIYGRLKGDPPEVLLC